MIAASALHYNFHTIPNSEINSWSESLTSPPRFVVSELVLLYVPKLFSVGSELKVGEVWLCSRVGEMWLCSRVGEMWLCSREGVLELSWSSESSSLSSSTGRDSSFGLREGRRGKERGGEGRGGEGRGGEGRGGEGRGGEGRGGEGGEISHISCTP